MHKYLSKSNNLSKSSNSKDKNSNNSSSNKDNSNEKTFMSVQEFTWKFTPTNFSFKTLILIAT